MYVFACVIIHTHIVCMLTKGTTTKKVKKVTAKILGSKYSLPIKGIRISWGND